jgi:hypothetical protein
MAASPSRQALRRWGNSLGIRLTASIAREAQLQVDQAVELSVVEGGVMIRPVRRRDLDRPQPPGRPRDEGSPSLCGALHRFLPHHRGPGGGLRDDHSSSQPRFHPCGGPGPHPRSARRPQLCAVPATQILRLARQGRWPASDRATARLPAGGGDGDCGADPWVGGVGLRQGGRTAAPRARYPITFTVLP